MVGARIAKDHLHAAWATIAKALASPVRIELLDVIAQGERTVDALARETGLTVNNASAHLKILKAARLLESRKDAQCVYHRLADDGVLRLIRDIQSLARRRLQDVDHVARAWLDDRDALEPIPLAELRRRLKTGTVTLLDVRPAVEFAAGHIPGALSSPLATMRRRLPPLPKSRPVVAYCRGPYSTLSVDAVAILRRRGYRALRLRDGFTDWKGAGFPSEVG